MLFTRHVTAKTVIFGVLIGTVVMLILPNAIPEDKYISETEMIASSYVLFNDTCPNKIGLIAISDAYINTVDKQSKRQWIQDNFEHVFSSKCYEIVTSNTIRSSSAINN